MYVCVFLIMYVKNMPSYAKKKSVEKVNEMPATAADTGNSVLTDSKAKNSKWQKLLPQRLRSCNSKNKQNKNKTAYKITTISMCVHMYVCISMHEYFASNCSTARRK